jgi:hypothetical protein
LPTTPSGLAATIRLTARIAPLRPSTTTRMRISRESMARSTYVVPSRCGGPSGKKPASRTILLISKGCTRPGTGAGAVGAGLAGGDWARPGAAANRRQHRDSAAAPNTPAIADLPIRTPRSKAQVEARCAVRVESRARTETGSCFIEKVWRFRGGSDLAVFQMLNRAFERPRQSICCVRVHLSRTEHRSGQAPFRCGTQSDGLSRCCELCALIRP